MKNYYVNYGRFGNEYSLRWAEAGQTVPDGYEQITRKEAEHLASAERQRRRNDPSFSGFADAYIYPFAPCTEHENPALYWQYEERLHHAQYDAKGYIVEI